MEVKKYDKIILDSTRSIDDIVAGIKAELSKQESQNAGESYICYVSHAYSSGQNAGVNYIVVSDDFKRLNRLSSNVIQANAYTKDEINELIATKADELNSRIDSVNSNLTNSINTKANQATTFSKDEINNLLNAKANSNAVVALSGNQTINGVKTFSSVPIVATQPTNANQVANKAYVDSKAVSGGSGDTTKASWGLNWNGGIELPSGQVIEVPSDGVVFLWVRVVY